MTVNCLRYVTAVVAGVVTLMMGSYSAEARPLKKEACAALAHERKELAGFGAERAIVKGPEWTRANMPAKMMDHVRRYLIVEEMLLFRCKGINLPELLSQEASAISVIKNKEKKPLNAQGITPVPPLPQIKPAIMPKLETKEASAVAKKEKKPEKAAKKETVTESIKTAAITGKAKTPAAASEGTGANAAIAVIPLPDRKPTPAERIAYAKAIAEAAARAAALKKKKTEALRVTTPDIQQLLLSTDNN